MSHPDIRVTVAATPLDDFLSGSSASETGEMLQRIGAFGSMLGITSALGLLVFLAAVHRGSRAEVATLLRIVGLAGGTALLGAAVELAGVASIGDLSWFDAVTDETGAAPMMRLLGGLLIAVGLFDHSLPVEPSELASDPAPDAAAATDDEHSHDVRWVPASASAFGIVGALLAVVSFWFDGHTVTRGPRVVHAIVDLAHVTAGSIWFGGIVGLCVLALTRRGRSVAPVALRFSSLAAAALILVTLAGSLMTLMVLDDLRDIPGTEWGRLLIVKVAAVATAAIAGGYNHFVAVPALDVARSDHARETRARVTILLETVLLAFVVAVTVFLTGASIT